MLQTMPSSVALGDGDDRVKQTAACDKNVRARGVQKSLKSMQAYWGHLHQHTRSPGQQGTNLAQHGHYGQASPA